MTIIERVRVNGEKDMELSPIIVNDVEIFKLDFVKYINSQRKRQNAKVTMQIKETLNGEASINYSRYEDPSTVECICGWTGPRSKSFHTYKSDNEGEVEPVDYCPICRREV